jgi:hypothetical protein
LPQSHSQLLTAQHNNNKEKFLWPWIGIGERNVIAQGKETVRSVGSVFGGTSPSDDRTVRRLYFMTTWSFNPKLPCCSNLIRQQASTADADAVIDKSHAAFDYHKQMAAGVLLWRVAIVMVMANSPRQTQCRDRWWFRRRRA